MTRITDRAVLSLDPRLGIGGNQPPLAERLAIEYGPLAYQAKEALEANTGLDPIMVDDDLETYSEAALALKNVVKLIEAARKKEKEQINKDGKTVEAHFAKLAKPIEDAIWPNDPTSIVGKINAWQRAQLAAARKAQAEREAAEREAAVAFDEPAPAPEAPVAAREVARVVSSSTGRVAAVASTKWLHRVVDPAMVPARYLMPNDAAIRAAVDSGVREIDGVEIYETVRTTIR